MPEKATSGAVAAVAYTNSCHPQKRDCPSNQRCASTMLLCQVFPKRAHFQYSQISLFQQLEKHPPAWSWWETTRTSSSVRKVYFHYSTVRIISSFIPSARRLNEADFATAPPSGPLRNSCGASGHGHRFCCVRNGHAVFWSVRMSWHGVYD